MKLYRSLWRGAALALLFLILTTSIGLSQSDTQSDTQAELQAVPPVWKVETIDDGRLFGELGQHSLAYGPGGVPHIAYGSDHLYHAYRNAGEWVIELVDSTPQVGKRASIAVDSVGHVYITYYDSANQNLKYATNWKGPWEITNLASNGIVGIQSRVFATWIPDNQGPEVYVGYLDSTNHNVWTTYSGMDNNGGWDAPELASGNIYVASFDMAMRGVQQYISIATGDSIYYAFTAAGWQAPELVNDNDCSPITAIAVDDTGTPYIPIIEHDTFHDPSLGYMTYLAYKDTTGWVGSDYPNLIYFYGNEVPESLSIGFSPWEGKVFIAYQVKDTDNSHHRLIVRKGLKDIGDVFTSFDIQTYVNGDFYAAVSVPGFTASPKAGVVYLANGDLKYKYLMLDNGPWDESQSPVDTFSDIGSCAVVRVDSSGNLHLMYYRSDTGGLLYKVSTATGWSTTHTITNPGERANCNFLAQPGMDLDSNGKPVISYVNSDHQLIYSKWSCVGRDCFSHSVVDSGLDFVFDGSAAIAMVTGDKPYILYHKNRKLTLAYDLTPAILDWTIGLVPVEPTTYGSISLETDNDGRLHAGFVTDIMDDPYYARFGFGGNIWSGLTILDEIYYTMEPVRVAVSPKSNNPQVAYVNNIDELIVTAYSCLPNLPCVWFPSIVDAPPDDVGILGAPALIIDSNGRRLLAYDYLSPQQGINGLKFMKIEGVVKTSQIIETTPGRVESTSIALRPGNVPVIAYHVPALGQIKVAWGPYSVFLPLVKR